MVQKKDYLKEIEKIQKEIEKMNLDYSSIKVIFISLANESKSLLQPLVSALLLRKYSIYATSGTKIFLENNGLEDINLLFKISETRKTPNFEELINSKKIDLIINIPSPDANCSETTDGENIRNLAALTKTPIITDCWLAIHLLLDLINK
ncbi:MAG: hypothetical protein HY973_01375 [Candidatus Kerfeldbacteria bacterium]|nr:hypothetical protein [Candidatus Kerfeldbacteria bacterium]